MKPLKVLLIPAVLLMVMATGMYSTDVTPAMLQEKGVFLETIGDDEVLCVIPTDNAGGERVSRWFILKGIGQNRELGSDLSAFLLVDQILASPGNKYLAVLSVGEGHPMVEVVDLNKLRSEGNYEVLHGINPYPGVVWIERWEGTRLIVKSDVPLTQKKAEGGYDADILLPEEEEFFLDAATGKIGANTVDKKR